MCASQRPAPQPTGRRPGAQGVADVRGPGIGIRSGGVASLCRADGEGAVRRAGDLGIRRLHCGDGGGERDDGGDTGHGSVRGGRAQDRQSMGGVRGARGARHAHELE